MYDGLMKNNNLFKHCLGKPSKISMYEADKQTFLVTIKMRQNSKFILFSITQFVICYFITVIS